MTPAERGDRAQRILDDEVFSHMLDDIRGGIVRRLEHAPISDIETQHELVLTLQLLKQLRDQLQNYVNDLTIARHKDRERTFMEKLRRAR